MKRNIDEVKLKRISEAVLDEFRAASATNGEFHSMHEAYAVMLEEMDEVKEEVWKKANNRSKSRLRAELTQVAAMAMRFYHDLL